MKHHGHEDTKVLQEENSTSAPSHLQGSSGLSAVSCEALGPASSLVFTSFDLKHLNESSWGEILTN